MFDPNSSLVQYVYIPGAQPPTKCGYCKSPDTFYAQGLWAYRMSCQDYQDLVDRGFQRSGKFVYRPIMDKTCCPQYVIRLDATKFRMSKSQRRAVKKLHRYLLHGNADESMDHSASDRSEKETAEADPSLDPGEPQASSSEMKEQRTEKTTQPHAPTINPENPVQVAVAASPPVAHARKKTKKAVRPGVGPDPSKPPCKKAKLIRRERKAQKLAAKTSKQLQTDNQPSSSAATECVPPPQLETEAESAQSPPLFAQSLEELLAVPVAERYAHRFEVRLVPCTRRSQEFNDTYQETYQVFRKFQIGVHKEDEADCDENNFKEFLVDSPLISRGGVEGMPCGYGSYLQQYLLDGKIFAVGLLDILPRGVLCEYLFYNPEYRFIVPGVFTALNEIALTQKFFRHNPEMQYYYMGFYVQSCPKMNYKNKYKPGYLLCPETYRYFPVEKCIPKLLVSAYSRLAEDEAPNVEEISEEIMSSIPVLANLMPMSYRNSRELQGDRHRALVEEYARLVGPKIAQKMTLMLPMGGFSDWSMM